MNLPNPQLILKLLYDISVNLTSGWFGLLFVSPGFFEFASFSEYFQTLRINLVLAIIGLVVSYWLLKRRPS